MVAGYSVPTTHFLTIVRKNPYLNNADFRRALVYGSNREAILKMGLLKQPDLKQAEVPGFRLISGPFPAAANASDAFCYANDESIEARAYDPKLALILSSSIAAVMKGEVGARRSVWINSSGERRCLRRHLLSDELRSVHLIRSEHFCRRNPL